MNTKNIHIIVKYFYPVAAGIETNILETYSVLAEKGYNVVIHTSRDTLTEKNVLPVEETYRGLHIKRYPYNWYGYVPEFNGNESFAICLHNFNIVPHLYVMLQTLIHTLLRKKNYVLILTPHGGFTPEWSIFNKVTACVKRVYHTTIGTLLINLTVDMLRAVSVWEKNEIIKLGVKAQKVQVISNGLEDEAYLDVDTLASPQIKKTVANFGGKYILQIGRIYSIKNYETVIRALQTVPKDIQYVIAGPVGDNQYFDSLKKLIAELQLQDRVHFVGVIRGVDKYFLIKHAEMMVHMAKWESFCNVVHEGMSQGLICLVANNTALPLLIKDQVNGYTIETFDFQALSDKINYVLKNKDTLKPMQQANIEFGREMSWRKVAEKMLASYLDTYTQQFGSHL